MNEFTKKILNRKLNELEKSESEYEELVKQYSESLENVNFKLNNIKKHIIELQGIIDDIS